VLSDRATRRRLVVFAVLIGLCLVLLVVSGSAPVREFRRGIQFAVSPMQDTLADGTRSVTAVLGAFSEVDTLRRENDELRFSVERLEDEIASLETVMDENKSLARMLDVKRSLDHETVAAEVTSYSSTQFERLVTLDRGSEAGIVARAPVLSEGGALAGRVLDVGQGWAEVMLLSDPRMNVAGLDSRTKATGDVSGRLDSPLEMTAIQRTDQVDDADKIVTLGAVVGRRFRSPYPKGLLIGRVLAVREEPGEILKTALVQPAADLEHLQRVLVITDHVQPRQRSDQPEDETGQDETAGDEESLDA
jgi:rod shape-determining protein MreC